MQLSIIIVNYNSKEFLEKCLLSLKDAGKEVSNEIIIVDNDSTDGSNEYLPAKFPEIKFFFNKENAGFAKACNKGFSISSGNYILFLNPDTIVSENCLNDCLSFFETNKDTGAVGVRMINEKGEFLRESKRGLPQPAASFYKLFGLASVFPRSKTFAKYYMGHLPEKENNSVEILSGAFMIIKREALEKAGGFDEDFFMYGEDIDLSFRIMQSGYKNYYLGQISITHIKGGSTAYNYTYVKHFYGSMKLFVKKQYDKKPVAYRLFLYTGIEIRKMMAMVGLLFR